MIKLRPVLVTPPSGDVVTLSEAKAWLWIDHSSHDDLVTGMISSAVAYLDGWSGTLGRCLLTQTWRQDFGQWSADLRLPFPDVSSVSVKYRDTSDVEQTVSAGNYELLHDHGGSLVRFVDNFTGPNLYDDRSDALQVTLTCGYGNAGAIPAPIKTAIKMMVAHWYANRESIAGTQMQEVPMGATALIEPYKRRRT